MDNKLVEILKPEIDKFISIIKEASNTAIYFVDDGPAVFYRNADQHKAKIEPIATMAGMKIIKYHLDEKPDFKFDYQTEIVPVVSFGRSDKWKNYILKVAERAGYKALRGISKKFGLEPDVLDAGTAEIYQKEKELKKNKNIKIEKEKFKEHFKRNDASYFHSNQEI